MSRSDDYGYAVARIRAMEPLLLDAGVMQRLLEADDAAGALKILGETCYARNLTEKGGQERYDAALEAELFASIMELRAFVPDKELVDLFRIQYDFHNVKVLLKSVFMAKRGGKKRWDLMTSLGTIPTDSLVVSVESEDYNLLPYGLPSIIPAALSLWEQTRDIVEVEKLLDSGLFAAMLKTAEGFGAPGVLKWVKARIDSENLRNLLRLKRFGIGAQKAAAFLHAGGTVSVDALAQLLPEPFESWGRALSHFDVGAAISRVQEEGGFDRQIVSLEKALDDYCRDVVSLARYSPNAPENVLAFLWGKEMEVKNIRTVLVSKGSPAGRDETRRMLRNGY
ncbi:MAG: V-type ATPase subunit [Synergistaceae bacterium]|jgi:V/A-type H+-transporting ATPase subunit C|nr:V-type ATPase subunit [Synergistaceae bacterium]